MCLRARFLFLTLLVAAPVHAQWMPAGPTNATPVFFARNPRAVFAAEAAGFVHRSTDDGRTWRNATPTYNNTNVVVEGMGATSATLAVFVRLGSSATFDFYRSATDGQSWTRVGSMPTNQSGYRSLVGTRSGAWAAIAPGGLPRDHRLAVSTDNGATWTLRPVFATGYAWSFAPQLVAVGDTLVTQYTYTYNTNPGFGTDCGIAFTADLGLNWTFRPALVRNCSSGNGDALTYANGRLYAGAYTSADFGATWTGLPSRYARTAAIPGVLVAESGANSETGRLFVSGADGTTNRRDVSDQVSNQLPVSLYSTGTAFLMGLERGGVYRSTDGATWGPAGRFEAQHKSDLIALTAHKGVLVAAWENIERIVRSHDRGATWHQNFRTLGSNGSLDDASTFYSADSVVFAGNGGVYRSRDMKTWPRLTQQPGSVKAFFRTGGRFMLAGTTGIYVSADAGTTWTQVRNQNFNQADVAVSGNRAIVTGGNGSVRSAALSLDGGQTWTAASGAGTTFQVGATRNAFLAAATGIPIFGGGTFLRSLDNGTTWRNVKPALGDSVAPTLLDSFGDTLIAIGPTYLAASTNDGTTWRKVTHTGLPFTFAGGGVVNFPTVMTRMGDTLYVAFDANGIWKRSLADLGLATAVSPDIRAERATLSVAPNPTRHSSTVSVSLGKVTSVRVAVFDALGREVALLHDGPLSTGTHRFGWGDAATPGLYLVRLDAGGARQTQMLVRLR
ncbi:MAG TPA: T9SS type A sorting domain-containing protein [Rhodothermales bacterium]|nr:T9SS type A sorting domain-containing protein [Rhodothermales bacterium]